MSHVPCPPGPQTPDAQQRIYFGGLGPRAPEGSRRERGGGKRREERRTKNEAWRTRPTGRTSGGGTAKWPKCSSSSTDDEEGDHHVLHGGPAPEVGQTGHLRGRRRRSRVDDQPPVDEANDGHMQQAAAWPAWLRGSPSDLPPAPPAYLSTHRAQRGVILLRPILVALKTLPPLSLGIRERLRRLAGALVSALLRIARLTVGG